MPYRGINTKRNTIHDKARGTLREEARAHFMVEKKEHDHELQNAIKTINKLVHDGFTFQEIQKKKHCVLINFHNTNGKLEEIKLEYPENLSSLKKHFNDMLNQH